MNVLRSCSFLPTIVYTDPAPGFLALVSHFPGIIIDTGGAKDNVAKVDIKIRRIKELCRSVQASLPWTLPKTLIKNLVSYAVARLNIRRTTAINRNICPKVLFTGIKVNFTKELGLEFGTYAKVYNGTDNTSRSRSIPCISLYPCSNSTGSWEFMNLKTKTRIRRSHWIKMKTLELIVEGMNRFDEKSQLPDVIELTQEAKIQEVQEITPGQSVVDQPEEEPDPVVNEPEIQQAIEVAEPEPPVSSRTRQQTGASILRPSKYTMATKLNKRTETDPKKLEAIKQAEVQDIKQIVEGLEAVEAVYEREVEGKAHGCHMFTVDKLLADSTFDKCKG